MVDRYAGVPICAMLSGLERLRNKRKSTAGSAKKILVIMLSEMGSLVLAQPMFAKLQEQYPNGEIHVLLFAKNREVLELLGVVAKENILTLDDSSLGNFAKDTVKVLRQMLRVGFDAIIDCELFARVSAIFSYLSNAPIRVGFHPHTQEGLYRGSFINRRVLYNHYRHMSQQFLTMAAAIESDTLPIAKNSSCDMPPQPPQLTFAPGELEEITARFHRDYPTINNSKTVLLYPSGGILPIRAWPLESYCQLAANLLQAGYAVGIIGMAQDRSYGTTIIDHCQNHPLCVDLTGYTKSVRQLIALFHSTKLLITNDGGPGHFIALTPTPAITLFGPETPNLYRSLSPHSHNFHTQLPCSPCLTAYNHRNSPCDGDNLCLKEITPEQVFQQARKMLQSNR